MLKRCAQLLGLVHHTDKDLRRKKEFGGAIRTLDLSIQLKDITVRIVHAGGREELYQSAVPASRLIDKYPGMCVARPEVFKKPYESILSAEEQLLPGNKYYIVPSTTIQKLKRKHSLKGKVKEPAEYKEQLLDMKVVANVDGEDYSEESICSAKDFYVSKGRWSRCLRNKSQKNKKPFIPPIQKPRVLRGLGWEPSLTSIQELSP